MAKDGAEDSESPPVGCSYWLLCGGQSSLSYKTNGRDKEPLSHGEQTQGPTLLLVPPLLLPLNWDFCMDLFLIYSLIRTAGEKESVLVLFYQIC